MRHEHRNIQHWIKRKYATRFRVEVEVDKTNYLPDRESHVYQPDVILRSDANEVLYIIEVENDPVRKALVGACILADYSIKALRQQAKPILIFIVYSKEGIRQMDNFRDKLLIAKEYCKDLSDVRIYTEKEFKVLDLDGS